ncbi:undecaprenyl-diphosphatase [Thermoanaerobacter uzonensis DSM 18761]|uniref:Undecaprenyl-diphosphatase n=1 Tax=Thermoanaerobacter uzonensis DSM 18761 TaxID=1123369 RepID=A0A1M5A6J3_9THEO|nr:undecaprenyl-diphosphatase [Thermoanaerobacter uzonensis]SHF25911.1 undecaprenyl-diphosphatase [Thermoanaerobacter uzonensis DSM 18761]
MNLTLFHMINGLAGHNIFLDKIMTFIAVYSPILYGMLMLVQWFIGGDKGKKTSMNAFFAAIIALGLNLIISTVYFEPRPFVHHKVNLLVKHPADASFPSDHASGGSALSFTELMYDKIIGSIMMVLTLLLLFARIYVGVHYPLDIIAGFIIGFISSKILRGLEGILSPVEGYIIKIWHEIFA